MTTNRIKVAPLPVLTRAEMEKTVAYIADAKVREQALTAQMNGEIEQVKRTYANRLDTIAEELKILSGRVREWAEANPSDFAKARSIDLTHAVIGWRTGMPSLKTLKGWTWDRVLEQVMARPFWKGFIRTSYEIDKAAIISTRDQLTDAQLREIGVTVKQDETFFIEAKIAQPERKEIA